MNKILAAMRNARIQTKLIASFTLLILLQTILQSVFYFHIASRQMVDTSVTQIAAAVAKDKDLTDMKLYAVDTSMQSYRSDPDLMRLLATSAWLDSQQADSLEYSLYRRYFWDQEEEVDSVYLLVPGRAAHHRGHSWTFDDFRAEFAEFFPFREGITWVPSRRLENGDLVFSAVGHWTYPHVTTADSQSLDYYVLVNLTPEEVYLSYESSLPTPGSGFATTTQDGALVHSSLPGDWPPSWWGDRPVDGSGSLEQIGDREYIFCHVISSITGWTTTVLVPTGELTGPLYDSGWLLLFLNNLASLIILAVLYYLSIRIMRPMHKLTGYAQRITRGDFELNKDLPQGGDVGILSDTILQLNEWLQILMTEHSEVSRREQEATIAALEMQLNPHFLFNTLNAINLLAMNSGQKEISSLIVNLSGMMHYTLDQENRFVRVEDELEFLRTYIYLMQTRYKDRFTVAYDIQPQVLNCVIPKLILQLCVENAILHGVKDLPGGGLITIRARTDGARLIIQVEDNGLGIRPNPEVQRTGKPHIGIENINMRIKLLFGDNFGLSIASSSDPTIVEIALPAIENVAKPC